MASQHFYSRVPARVSMFNRTDCFDTFACSSDIDRDFCEKELSNICNIALSVEDVEDIRLGKIPPLYSQFTAKTGELVQSCMTFLPVDYSGERSAYLVHSLVFKGEEKDKLLANPKGPIFDAGRFTHDISSFAITDPGARPNPDYPAFSLEEFESEDFPFPESVSGNMRRRWLGAVLSLLCGKIKTLFVSFPAAQKEEQNGFLCQLFNATLHIMPYHLRGALSFVTNVSNQNQLPAFRIRGTSLLPEQFKLSKSAVISFDKKTLLGISDDEISQQLREINFLFGISEQNVVRKEFLKFVEHVVKLAPALDNTGFQSISDLILMFQNGCEYQEYRVPVETDDAVLTLITLYEKFRKAIPDEYRIRMLQVLERYPAEHREIPKKVFSKLAKMYPTEIYGSRRMLLRIVLELIHTDLMRNKLMSFLSSVIDKEEPEAQADIALHLSRVMYGGFLQSQILTLFSDYYSSFDESTRTAILEKILLIIRTKAVQEQVISFLDDHYDEMTEEQKALVLDTVFEQLEEGDELAVKLIAFLNKHSKTSSEEDEEDLKNRIRAAIDKERSRKSDYPLVRLTANLDNYFAMMVAEYVLFDLFDKKIFHEWLKSVLSVSWNVLVKNLFVLCRITDWDEFPKERFAEIIVEEYDPKRSGLVDLGSALDAWRVFADRSGIIPDTIRNNIISVHIRNLLRNVFSARKQEMTIETILERIAPIPSLFNSEEAKNLRKYVDLRRAVEQNDLETASSICDDFYSHECRAAVASYMKRDLENWPESAPLLASAYVFDHLMGTGKCGIDEEFQNVSSRIKVTPQGKINSKSEAAALEKAEFTVMHQILRTGFAVTDDTSLSEAFQDAFVDPDSGLREAIGLFVQRYDSKGKSEIEKCLASFKNPENAFVSFCREILKQSNHKRGLFASLFGKK